MEIISGVRGSGRTRAAISLAIQHNTAILCPTLMHKEKIIGTCPAIKDRVFCLSDLHCGSHIKEKNCVVDDADIVLSCLIEKFYNLHVKSAMIEDTGDNMRELINSER